MFSVAQLAIVAAALDERLFYNVEFNAFCDGPWRALHPSTDHCISGTAEQPWDDRAPLGQLYWDQVDMLKRTLSLLPRGAYALLRYAYGRRDDQRETWTVFVHDGEGNVTTPVLSHLNRRPTFAEIEERMILMELFDCRQAEEQRRREVRSRQVIGERGWRVGKKVTLLSIEGKRYASGTISSISEGGMVSMTLAKRGTTQRWAWTGPAQHVHLEKSPADAGMPLVVDARSGETLLSAAA